MKVFVTTMIAVAAVSSAYAQGTVSFRNRVAGSLYVPIYGPNPATPTRTLQGNSTTNQFSVGTVSYAGHPYLLGTGYTAALFAGAVGTAPDALGFITSQPFGTSANLAGIWVAPSGVAPAIPGALPNGNATAQVRAWDNVGGTLTTWAAVLAAPPTVARGVSAVFTINALGDPADATKTPANLNNLTSFNIAPVPEPGIIALGVLGLGALLLRRRK